MSPIASTPRTPWPASGVALRVGVSLTLLAVTVPLMVHRVRQVTEGQGFQAQGPRGQVRDRFEVSGPSDKALNVAVNAESHTLAVTTMNPASTSPDLPRLKASLTGGVAFDRLHGRQDARSGDIQLDVLAARRRLGNPARLDLRINPATPLSLGVQSSTSSWLDLRRANLRGLTVQQDVGELSATFPAQGQYSAEITLDLGRATLTFPPGSYSAQVQAHSDVGSITVHVPRGANVRLKTATDLGPVRLPEGYTSSGTNPSRVEENGLNLTLDLSTDTGSIVIKEDSQ